MNDIIVKSPEEGQPETPRRRRKKKAEPKPIRPVGRRVKRPVVTGEKSRTRMVRVHIDFASWLVNEAERQTKQYGRTITITELTQSLYRKLAK